MLNGTNERLTLEQVKKRHHGEWVLLADPVMTDRMELVSGRVLFHSRDRDEVYEHALHIPPMELAYYFAGDIPDETEIVL